MLVPKYELFLEYTEKTQNQELQTLLTGATRSHQKRVEKRVPYTFSILINFYMSKYKLPPHLWVWSHDWCSVLFSG